MVGMKLFKKFVLVILFTSACETTCNFLDLWTEGLFHCEANLNGSSERFFFLSFVIQLTVHQFCPAAICTAFFKGCADMSSTGAHVFEWPAWKWSAQHELDISQELQGSFEWLRWVHTVRAPGTHALSARFADERSHSAVVFSMNFIMSLALARFMWKKCCLTPVSACCSLSEDGCRELITSLSQYYSRNANVLSLTG